MSDRVRGWMQMVWEEEEEGVWEVVGVAGVVLAAASYLAAWWGESGGFEERLAEYRKVRALRE